jgi:hypothetical protein
LEPTCGGQEDFDSERLQSVAREKCRRFPEFFMIRRLSSPEIIVIEAREVIVNEGETMNHLDRAGSGERGSEGEPEECTRGENDPGADPLSWG